MTDAELDAIRARLEKATPGPWVAHKTLSFQPAYVTSEDADVGAEMLTVDATFIAHARTDIPALLDELATARKENERLREYRKALEMIQEVLIVGPDDLEQELDAIEALVIPVLAGDGADHNPALAYLHSATEDADDRTT